MAYGTLTLLRDAKMHLKQNRFYGKYAGIQTKEEWKFHFLLQRSSRTRMAYGTLTLLRDAKMHLKQRLKNKRHCGQRRKDPNRRRRIESCHRSTCKGNCRLRSGRKGTGRWQQLLGTPIGYLERERSKGNLGLAQIATVLAAAGMEGEVRAKLRAFIQSQDDDDDDDEETGAPSAANYEMKETIPVEDVLRGMKEKADGESADLTNAEQQAKQLRPAEGLLGS